jgi:hypothetical protein
MNNPLTGLVLRVPSGGDARKVSTPHAEYLVVPVDEAAGPEELERLARRGLDAFCAALDGSVVPSAT